MSKRPYQHLPPLEHRPDGSPYRITPPQKRRASGLIRRECCNCEDGNCLALDDGDTCACPQMISFSVCCKWFRWAVLPLDGTLNRGGWYHLSFAPENGPLTVHKTRYDKHDLYSPAGKGVQFHPAPQFPF